MLDLSEYQKISDHQGCMCGKEMQELIDEVERLQARVAELESIGDEAMAMLDPLEDSQRRVVAAIALAIRSESVCVCDELRDLFSD